MPILTRARSSSLAKFIRDRRGVAAVEFALIAPVAVFLLLGEYTFCEAMSINRKLEITAHSVADLVARQTSVSSSSLSTILNASAQIAAPYSISNMTVIVAEYTTDNSGNTTVTWSGALNGTALTQGAKVTLPSGLAQKNTSLVYSNVSYSFTPLLGQNIWGSMTLNSQFYMNPRITATVTYTN